MIDLNRRIVDRIRIVRQTRYRDSMAEFNVGDRVTFEPDCGHEVIGTVVRLNRKSVTVATADGHQWRVSPTLLNRAPTEGSRDVVENTAQVMSLAEHRREG